MQPSRVKIRGCFAFFPRHPKSGFLDFSELICRVCLAQVMMATFFFLLRALIHNKAGVGEVGSMCWLNMPVMTPVGLNTIVPVPIDPQIVMDLFGGFLFGGGDGCCFLFLNIYTGPFIFFHWFSC